MSLETSGTGQRSRIVAGKAALVFIAAAAWIVVYISLDRVADVIVYGLLAMKSGSRLSYAVRFFLFEAPKVLMLLVVVVFGIGIIRTYFSAERTRRILGARKTAVGNIMASVLGIVTPFCSCSAVPLFIGFVEAGVPLGVTFSFLVAAPMINEVAVVLLIGLFGWKTAVLYVTTGLTIAVLSGYIIGRLHMERFVEDWVFKVGGPVDDGREERVLFSDRIGRGLASMKEIVGKVWLYVLAGIAVGAWIHGYVPGNFMAGLMGKAAWWSVPAAVLIGVPLYSNAAGIIPIVQALLDKGASLGTVLAFMMSVVGLSLPETVILRKVLKMKLIITFVGVVAAGIVVVGYIFNLVY